jgi:hypothetical protein
MAIVRLTRRAVFGALAGAATILGGICYFEIGGEDDLIVKVLKRRLPGVRVEPTSMAALSRDIQASLFKTSLRRIALRGGGLAADVIGIDSIAEIAITAKEFQRLERIVVTFFILGSNFLDVADPRTELVTYYAAPGVCPSRFAQYD